MNLDYPDDHPGFAKLLQALAAHERAAPPEVPLPAGVGCWYRQGPGEPWQAMAIELWELSRLMGCEGEFARRTRA